MYLGHVAVANDYPNDTRNIYRMPAQNYSAIGSLESVAPVPVITMPYRGTIRLELIAEDIAEIHAIKALLGKKIKVSEDEKEKVVEITKRIVGAIDSLQLEE